MIENDFKKILKEKGLKATPQRLLILNVIQKNGHIDIEKIYSKITEILPSISIATVYKNLKTLIDADIVQEVNLKSFKTLYEVKKEEHIHLICKQCKNVYDLILKKEDLKKYFKNFLSKEIDDIEVCIYSKCDNCKQ